MNPTSPNRRWWLIAAFATLAAWLVGAYLPATSNLWVHLNLIAPAGHHHLLTFPLAYPAVGVDLHTLASLTGLIMTLAAAVRWITYLEHFTPQPPQQLPAGEPAPRSAAPTPTPGP